MWTNRSAVVKQDSGLRLLLAVLAVSSALGTDACVTPKGRRQRIRIPEMWRAPADPSRTAVMLPRTSDRCYEGLNRKNRRSVALGCLLPTCVAKTVPILQGGEQANSDPAAVSLLDRMIGVAGGTAAWESLHEVSWLETTVLDGVVRDVNEFALDLPNARFRRVDLSPEGVATVVVGSLSGEHGDAYRVLPSGCLVEFMTTKSSVIIAESASKVREAALLFLLPFSLRGPGIRLGMNGTRPSPSVVEGEGKPRYDVLRVLVGKGDSLDVVVEKKSGLPVLVEQQQRTNAESVGIWIRNWRRVGRIQLATRRVDAATAKTDEVKLMIPQPYDNRVSIEPTTVPRKGLVTIISEVETHPDVDDTLFKRTLDRMH